MPPQTPLLLVDNVFDTVQLYPTGTVTADSERTGHEAHRVAGYRRERASWQTTAAAAGHAVKVDLGAGVSRASQLPLPRSRPQPVELPGQRPLLGRRGAYTSHRLLTSPRWARSAAIPRARRWP
jgi:hypothetical protein